MYDKVIIDADLCIKLGGSEKYRFLFDYLPCISKEIYMHSLTYSEVKYPSSAVNQLNELRKSGVLRVVSENDLSKTERAVYDLTYKKLAAVMLFNNAPRKNKGEVSALSYAQATRIPIFATDESQLQPIVDAILNTGVNDISCVRIINMIELARDGEIEIPRKAAKAIWRISNSKDDPTKTNAFFDNQIWPIKD